MEKQIKHRTGIRRKITLLICGAVFVMIIIGIGLGYYWGINLVYKTIKDSYIKMASLQAAAIGRIINEEIEDIKVRLSSHYWKNAVEEANLKYKDIDPNTIKESLIEIDKRWIVASEDSPLVKDYLDNPISTRLRELVKSDRAVAETFLTDINGGLVATSGKTSDFYQADEKWWQMAFYGGEGRDVVEDVIFDKSAGIMSISLLVPIKDNRADVIGISKTVMDIKRLLEVIEDFKIGKTGHASLIGENGYIIFHEGMEPLAARFMDSQDFSNLLKHKTGIFTVEHAYPSKERIFVVYSEVKNPILLENGIYWGIAITQETKEVFAPIRRLVIQAVTLAPILIIVMIPLGFMFGGIFVKPVRQLHEGTEHIINGNLDYKVNIKTNDELEQLADSFNAMTAKLKKTTTSIDILNKEIDARKKVERKLSLVAEEWKKTFNAITDFIFILDRDSTILKVNKAFAEAFKMEPEDIVGKKCYELLHKRDSPWPDCPCEGSKKDKKPHTKVVEDPVIGVPLLVATSPIYEDGEIVGMVHIAKDITELKKAEKKTKEAMEIKSQFISVVSHELRTPLTAIKEGISIVADGTTGKLNKEQKEFLDIAKRNSERLARLINDVLDFQKLESGKMDFYIRENDINRIVRETYETMDSLAKEKQLKLSLRLAERLPRINFDKDKITQVLTNLINNAIKFTEKGTVVVATTKEEGSIKVSIKDTGRGIKKEDISKLFHSFEQLEGEHERKVGGSGLGLAISKEIIERHKGKIWAESEYGKGAIFYFTLPT